MELKDKVALISGGATGMGASHARVLIAHGARVVIADIADDEGTRLARELGTDARFSHLDVRNDADWAAAVDLATTAFGHLDVLVNNAGVTRFGSALDCTDEDWQFVIDVNLTGTFKGIRSTSPAMITQGGGSIINIASTAGLKGFPGNIAYGASKWGVRGLTKHAALDLAPYGIRVNSIHPGNVSTPMLAGFTQDFRHVAQKRPADPREISELVLFLASDASSFSTGSEFVADGGETAGLPARVPRQNESTGG